MGFLIRRVAGAALLLFGISVLSFVLSELAPGDYSSGMRMDPGISAHTVDALRREYGLGEPLPVRYLLWMKSVLRGEFGVSFAHNVPVSAILWRPLANTLKLALLGLCLAWAIALPTGVWCAAHPGSWPARLTDGLAGAIISVPDILVALACIIAGLQAGLLRVSGDLPVAGLAMTLVTFPAVFRHTQRSVRQTLCSGFVESMRSHGLPENSILFRYALPVAANPLISLLGLSFASLLSSSLVIEVVLGWPGLGPLLLEAIFARDIHVVVAVVLLSALLLLVANLLCDFVQYVIDPRIRVGEP